MTTDLAIVYSPVGGGHRSAALATAEAAEARGLRVRVLDAFDHAPRWVGEAYVTAHLKGQSAAPNLYGRLYFAANRRQAPLEALRLGLDNLLFGELSDAILSVGPRAIIATHHLPLVVLARARRTGLLAAPVLGVVTDYTAHAHWAERGVDAWAVPHGDAAADLERHGVDPLRILPTGIPVRAAFERMGLPGNPGPRTPLHVLVTSGGFGHGPMTRIVRSFAGIADVHLTVICGANETLRARMRDAVRESGLRAEVVGFEPDMPARVAAAHVLVGKAGGLTITETLTAGRTMIIASAVPGNEELNESFVVRGGAGASARADEVGRCVSDLRQRGLLVPMGARGRTLVPVGAASAVVQAAMNLAACRERAA